MKNFQIPILFIILSIVALITELTIFTVPLTYIIALIALIYSKKASVFIFAFILGLAIDALRVESFGITPLFIFITTAVIYLYEKYSGSDDILIAICIAILSVIIYTLVLSYSFFWVLIVLILLVLISRITTLFMSKYNLHFNI